MIHALVVVVKNTSSAAEKVKFKVFLSFPLFDFFLRAVELNLLRDTKLLVQSVRFVFA